MLRQQLFSRAIPKYHKLMKFSTQYSLLRTLFLQLKVFSASARVLLSPEVLKCLLLIVFRVYFP